MFSRHFSSWIWKLWEFAYNLVCSMLFHQFYLEHEKIAQCVHKLASNFVITLEWMKGNYIFPDSSLISFFAVHGIKGFQDEIHVQEVIQKSMFLLTISMRIRKEISWVWWNSEEDTYETLRVEAFLFAVIMSGWYLSQHFSHIYATIPWWII